MRKKLSKHLFAITMGEFFKSGRVQLALIIIFVLLSFSFARFMENDTLNQTNYQFAERVLFVNSKKIIPGEYRISYQTTGIVEARHEIEIIPQVSGRVVWVNEKLHRGELFKQKEALFEINREDYDLELIKTEAEVARANTALDIEIAESEASMEEWKDLTGNKEAPDLISRKPQLDEAQSRLKAALAQRERARLNLDRTIFRLPFDAQITESHLSEGQYVAAGHSYGRAYDRNYLEVASAIPDNQLNILFNSHNQDVDLEIDLYGKKRIYRGKIYKTANSIDRSSRFANIRIKLLKPDMDLLVGNFAKVNIKGEKLKDIAVIPLSAMQKDRTILIIKEDNTIIKFKPKIVQMMDKTVAISGIDHSFRVITNNMPNAISGMRVSVSTENENLGNHE